MHFINLNLLYEVLAEAHNKYPINLDSKDPLLFTSLFRSLITKYGVGGELIYSYIIEFGQTEFKNWIREMKPSQISVIEDRCHSNVLD